MIDSALDFPPNKPFSPSVLHHGHHADEPLHLIFGEEIKNRSEALQKLQDLHCSKHGGVDVHILRAGRPFNSEHMGASCCAVIVDVRREVEVHKTRGGVVEGTVAHAHVAVEVPVDRKTVIEELRYIVT